MGVGGTSDAWTQGQPDLGGGWLDTEVRQGPQHTDPGAPTPSDQELPVLPRVRAAGLCSGSGGQSVQSPLECRVSSGNRFGSDGTGSATPPDRGGGARGRGRRQRGTACPVSRDSGGAAGVSTCRGWRAGSSVGLGAGLGVPASPWGDRCPLRACSLFQVLRKILKNSRSSFEFLSMTWGSPDRDTRGPQTRWPSSLPAPPSLSQRHRQ